MNSIEDPLSSNRVAAQPVMSDEGFSGYAMREKQAVVGLEAEAVAGEVELFQIIAGQPSRSLYGGS